MKKIIFIHLYNDISGSPKVLSEVIKIIKKKKIPYQLLTSNHNGFLSKFKNTKFVFFDRSDNKIFNFFYYFISQLNLFLECIKYINKDVIFYLNTAHPFSAALAAKLIRKKIIYHIHETSLKPRIMKLFLFKIIKFTAHQIIFVSNFLKRMEGFGTKKEIVINNFAHNEIKKKKKYRNNFNVLMICSLKEYKGVFNFIDIAEKLIQNKYIKFRLVTNESKRNIKLFFKYTNLPSNIKIYSKKLNVTKFYIDSNILLNLSDEKKCIETSGLTILEAISHSLPCIVPTKGGPNEIIKNGFNGYKISSKKINLISKKILKIYNNKKIYTQLSQNAYKSSTNYSFYKFRVNILKIIYKYIKSN